MEYAKTRNGILVPKFRDLDADIEGKHDMDEMIRIAKKYDMRMTDGAFYQDTRYPHMYQNAASVTLSTTDKALYVPNFFPTLGTNYWRIGKKLRLELFGRITTAATPGNGTVDIYWGSGVDATGTILQSSQAFALTASQTNLSWFSAIKCYCTAEGTTGTLFVTGWIFFNEAVVAPKQLIPASAAATSATLDITTASIISYQFKRSGSTAETMQVHDLDVTSYN